MKLVRMELDGAALGVGAGGTVATVGTFDGLHLGHREVLGEIVRRAAAAGRRSALVTFEPHPLRIVRPQDAPPLLTSLEEKADLLQESGLDYLCVLPFTPVLQAYPARRFVTEILLERVEMRELVMGYDHGFGRGREGSVETLRALGEECGFGVDVVQAVLLDDAPVSSTRVRNLLAAGEVAAAARLLGRPYSVRGVVRQGDRRGRDLGFPTANIAVEPAEKLMPKPGIYAAHGVVDGARVPGLLHLGPRPTFDDAGPTVELHLLDWAGDLYGEEVAVEFCGYLREIVAYASAEELVAQMHRDAADGRRLLTGQGPESACV